MIFSVIGVTFWSPDHVFIGIALSPLRVQVGTCWFSLGLLRLPVHCSTVQLLKITCFLFPGPQTLDFWIYEINWYLKTNFC
jgi:hypothetical protein